MFYISLWNFERC